MTATNVKPSATAGKRDPAAIAGQMMGVVLACGIAEYRPFRRQMNLSALLGKKLKEDDVLDVLEIYAIENVIYDFDRDHENIEDAYWAPARAAGFQLRFNQDQVLLTIFCYIAPLEGFSPVSQDIVGVPIYETFDDAEEACRRNELRYSTSDSRNGPEFHKLWLRIEGAEVWTHYQFEDGSLVRLTLILPAAV